MVSQTGATLLLLGAVGLACCAHAGCGGGPMRPPSDEREGSGGKSGTGDSDHLTPAERTDYRLVEESRPQLSADERRAVAQATESAAIAEYASRLADPSMASSGTVHELADWHLRTARQLSDLTGHIEVENAGRSTQEFESFRLRVESLTGPALERALLQELNAIHEQDAQGLRTLSTSQHAPLRAFATEALAEAESNRSRRQSTSVP